MERGAKLGVHPWSAGSTQAKDLPRTHPDHEINARYIREMLGTDVFYWFTIHAAPANGIYWMTYPEIESYRLTTQAILPPCRDNTPFGETFTSKRNTILEE